MSKNEVQYIIYKPRHSINLNIFEAEKYESAIVVQQLIGTLVFYSNFGRYESRLAQKWERTSNNIWTFYLKPNLACEDGEIIDALSFKMSLERSLVIYANKGEIPVLNNLKGFKEFIEKNKYTKDLSKISSIDGILALGNRIVFEFDKPVRSGLLQVLSFSPFGYLSLKNFKINGEWKDNAKFLSSGPYRVEIAEIGKRFVLTKNPHWKNFGKKSPEKIQIHHKISDFRNSATIVDIFTHDFDIKNLNKFKLFPEYINSVLLGNLEFGFFANRKIRQAFKSQFNKKRDELLPSFFGSNIRSKSFYPTEVHKSEVPFEILPDRPKKPLRIEGVEPPTGTPRYFAWQVVKAVLQDNGIPYEFSNTEGKFSEMIDRSYDIRIRGSSIGGGVEAWGLYITFCSPFGINFPDPGNRVCNLVLDYERDRVSDSELSYQFISIVEEEAAILTVSHYGIQLFISDDFDLNSISPMMSVIRFDQLALQ